MYKMLCRIKKKMVEILYWIFLSKLISEILNVFLFFFDSHVKICIRFSSLMSVCPYFVSTIRN